MKQTLLLALAFLYANSILAQIFQDDFSGYTTGSNLSGQGTWTNNSSLAGFGNCVGALCSNAKVIDQPIAYPGYGSAGLSVELKPEADGVGTPFAAITSGSIYTGFVVNITSAAASPNDFFRVCSGSSFTTTFRIFIKSMSASTFAVGISKGGGGNPTVYTTNTYAYGQDHLFIVKYNILAGSNDDTVSLYVNPVAGAAEPATADAFTAGGTDQASSIDRMGFRQNASNIPVGRAGLVIVTDSWAAILKNSSFGEANFTADATRAKYGELTFTSNKDTGDCKLQIFSINGALLESKLITINEGTSSVAITPITTAGVYILNLTTGSNERFSKKIIVN